MVSSIKNKIFFFGFGYTAKYLYEIMKANGWLGSASIRSRKNKTLREDKIEYFDFFEEQSKIEEQILSSKAVLISIPPSGKCDPVLEKYGEVFKEAGNLGWVGYLSSTSVYGNFNGKWVSEDTNPLPTTTLGQNRLFAERKWEKVADRYNLPIIRFRISGIYGPDRNPLERIKKRTQRIILKENQIFNRVHIDDLCKILYRSINSPRLGRVYNIADNEPSTSEEFISEAARLLSYSEPERVNISDANLSGMALSFYADSKRVSNKKIVKDLGYTFKYPSFKEGLKSLV